MRRLACCEIRVCTNVTVKYCFKRVSNRFRHWDPDSLGYRFLAEAKRLWEFNSLNMERPRLGSIQGVMIINIVLNLHGLDKHGDLYGLQGLVAAKAMGLFEGSAHIGSERERHAMDFTAWCLFNMDTYVELTLIKLQIDSKRKASKLALLPPSFP